MATIIKQFIAALQFLTIFRITNKIDLDPKDFSASLAFFPLIGLLLGTLLAVTGYLFLKPFPASVAGALMCAFYVFLTRGLHLDGIADVFDALGSHKPKEQMLQIMKDSHIGAIGVIALVLVLILKSSGFGILIQSESFKFIALVPVLGRFSLHVLAAFSHYARPEGGLGEGFVGEKARAYLLPSALITVLASIFLAGFAGLLLTIAITLLALFFVIFFKRALGGVTGDVLGFQIEIAETVLLSLGALLYHG